MKMNDTVARIVEIMFQDVEQNEETAAIRDEVMNNCQERFADLVNSGVSEDDAIAAVIESLKGMDEILAPYKKQVQPVSDEEEALGGKQHVIFAAGMVHAIDLHLISEDVNIEASDDENYHVLWDTKENALLKVELRDGVIRVGRQPAEEIRMEGKNVRFEAGNISDFMKSEDGKIEIDMNGFRQSMKSFGEKIKLTFANGLNIDIGRSDDNITIQVPDNAVPHVKLLTASGDISVQDAELTELDVTTTSGDIDIDLDADQRLERLELRTTSGDVEADAYADLASISSTSGDVDVNGQYRKLSISTISGDMDVRADIENMSFGAISGDVDLIFESNMIRKVCGSTISGDIDINLPNGIGTMAIQTQTRSGDVTTSYRTDGVGPTVTGGISSMSGDIIIR